ncbi:peptidoglycan editing factor PgeF [Algihabitans albus]|uniref:peptidoglycan editing factor PgeF n=1 Tax=Algihabitans albus TaxID=2164067 RepID=UPI000E5D0392|nr:peptidoglycan editing factor PgeF [Algihabitans albus]
MLTIGPINELPGVRHAFFSREGGVSQGLYASLNCGPGSDDDPAAVRENRRRALAHLDLPGDALATLHQVHSAEVVEVTESWEIGQGPRADGMVTKRPGVALGVLAADCAPVLLADAEAGVVGACHAGWKGAVGGVLEATVAAMLRLGAEAGRIVAGIGPCIAQRSYEVGESFPKPFLDQDADNAKFFSPSARASDKLHFDLRGYVARRLKLAEVGNVQVLPCDTCGEPERFFSYRRATKAGEPDYGRLLSVIYLGD